MVSQNDIGNKNLETTIIAPVTGAYGGYTFEVLVEASNSPCERNSSVRLDQIPVVSIKKQIQSVVGSLDKDTMTTIDEALKLSLGLD